MGMAMSWITSHPKLAVSLTFFGMFVVLNALACRHAWAMTRFLPGGTPKRHVEELTRLERLRTLLGGMRLSRAGDGDQANTFGLTCLRHRFQGVSGTLEAWYVAHPDPAGLVLLFHGYNGCKARLLPEARCFYDLGYSGLLVDFPGSGGSEGAVTTVGYREAGDVAQAVTYARSQWPGQQLTLFGQSMGAAAVLRALADLGVEAVAAILECPFDRLLNTVKARFAVMGIPAFPAAHLLLFWGSILNGYNGFAHNPSSYAQRVRCPTLLLHGRDDRRVTRSEVEAVFAALAGVKQLHFFDGLGHESFAAQRPEEWKGFVAPFLHAHALTT
jgi:alpha-beta hydrolase superfamily lysophospholipase